MTCHVQLIMQSIFRRTLLFLFRSVPFLHLSMKNELKESAHFKRPLCPDKLRTPALRAQMIGNHWGLSAYPSIIMMEFLGAYFVLGWNL